MNDSTPAYRIKRALGFCYRRFWPQKVKDALKDAASAVAELERERDETIRKLRDPVAVHVAMLRGEIAVPPLAELLHVYGATFSDLDAANIELAKARETIRQLNKELDDLIKTDNETIRSLFAKQAKRAALAKAGVL